MAVLFYVICTAWCQWDFLMLLSMNDLLPGCLFPFVVINCFMIRVNVWYVYLALQNIPCAISVLTLGNKVIFYRIVCLLSVLKTYAGEVEHLSVLKRSPVLLLKKNAMGHEQTPGPGRLHRDPKHTGYMDAVLKAFQKVTTCMKCSR